MVLEIIEVVPNKDPNKEYIVLHSYSDLNLDDYILLSAMRDRDKFKAYRLSLSPAETPCNSIVKIYSGIGEESFYYDKDKNYVHLGYLNSKDAIWDRQRVERVYLFNITTDVSTASIK
jgi:hypothetical protein